MTVFSIDYSDAEFIGQRDSQEDAHLAVPLEDGRAIPIVLADGMGGHVTGNIGSQTAVESFCRHPASSGAARLGSVLQAAQERLAEAVQLVPEFSDMGCTLVGPHIGGGAIRWISAGDFPQFLQRKGKIARLNQDDSMAPILDALVASGKLAQAEAEGHPDRPCLRSVIVGTEPPGGASRRRRHDSGERRAANLEISWNYFYTSANL